MDLNEKLAQRRLELEKEKRIEESKVAEIQSQKDQVVKATAMKQLAEQGIELDSSKPTETEVEKEKEKIIAALAQKRMTHVDNVVLIILAVVTIWGFFQGFVPGLIFLGFLIAYFNIRINKLKDQILNEAKSN